MRRIRRPGRLTTWCIWLGLIAGATWAMMQARDVIDQVHVILVYLLLVLGASTSGERLLAITLSVLGFVSTGYFFQPPYGSIADGKPLDWVALVAFLATAIVATHLLTRAQKEAREAEARAVEIQSLARLGSETLSAGRAADALARIAEVIQMTLGVSECSILSWDDAQGFRAYAGAPNDGADGDEMLRTVLERAQASWVRASGEIVAGATGEHDAAALSAGEPIQKIVIPLTVQGRVVGVLRVSNLWPVELDLAKRRFLDAISYYAALAVDRVRLVAEAEHAEALREADRLKNIVLASVSHDLRTPLTTIKALAQSEALQGNRSAAAIEEQADRLTRLVSDLLDLSRLKGGGFVATPELNTAEDLVGAAVRQTRGLFGDRVVRTIIDLDSPALVGYFDFAQSLRILVNLLENAARYSPPAQAIELSATREGDMLVFSVADRGPGIEDADVAHIFEPFYRARSAAPDTGRAGLGLSIAKTLAEMQGGAVTYARRVGGGSVFALRLPATEIGVEALEQSA
jgi:two-component system sensor histidine kinase KdpD